MTEKRRRLPPDTPVRFSVAIINSTPRELVRTVIEDQPALCRMSGNSVSVFHPTDSGARSDKLHFSMAIDEATEAIKIQTQAKHIAEVKALIASKDVSLKPDQSEPLDDDWDDDDWNEDDPTSEGSFSEDEDDFEEQKPLPPVRSRKPAKKKSLSLTEKPQATPVATPAERLRANALPIGIAFGVVAILAAVGTVFVNSNSTSENSEEQLTSTNEPLGEPDISRPSRPARNETRNSGAKLMSSHPHRVHPFDGRRVGAWAVHQAGTRWLVVASRTIRAVRVFDIRKEEFTFRLDNLESPKFAANANSLCVMQVDKKRRAFVDVYDLATGEARVTNKDIGKMDTSNAFVAASKTNGSFYFENRAKLYQIDPTSGEIERVGTPIRGLNSKAPRSFRLTGISRDGKLLFVEAERAVFGVTINADKSATWKRLSPRRIGDVVSQSPDGSTLFSAMRPYRKGLLGATSLSPSPSSFCAPLLDGAVFARCPDLSPNAEWELCRSDTGEVIGSLGMLPAGGAPRVGSRKTGGFASRMVWDTQSGKLAIVQRDTNAVSVVDIDIRSLIDKSGLAVASSPPTHASRNTELRYQVAAFPETGARYSLDFGPPNSNINNKGKLTWTVPDDYPGELASFIVRVQRGNGEPVLHSFAVSVL